jgi:hypothetical protein
MPEIGIIKAAGGMKTTQQAIEEIVQEDRNNYQQALEELIVSDPGVCDDWRYRQSTVGRFMSCLLIT